MLLCDTVYIAARQQSTGPIHFTVMSTEHDFRKDSDQYSFIASDLAAVDRTVTPWLVFAGHR
jgi:acid phosphatase type 7